MRRLAQHTLGVLVNACISRTLVTKRWQEVGEGASLEEVGPWGQVLGADLVLSFFLYLFSLLPVCQDMNCMPLPPWWLAVLKL